MLSSKHIKLKSIFRKREWEREDRERKEEGGISSANAIHIRIIKQARLSGKSANQNVENLIRKTTHFFNNKIQNKVWQMNSLIKTNLKKKMKNKVNLRVQNCSWIRISSAGTSLEASTLLACSQVARGSTYTTKRGEFSTIVSVNSESYNNKWPGKIYPMVQ